MSFLRFLASSYRRNRQQQQPQLPLVNGRAGDVRGFAGMDRWRSEDKGRSKAGTETVGEIPPEKTSQPPSRFAARWVKWLAGCVLTLVVPMWEKKWRSLLRIGGEVEMVADVAEEVADAVEKVANAVEQVSSEVAERMPEDAKLKGAVLLVEHVSKEAAEDARIAKDIIHKVDEVKQDVELLLESFVAVDGGKGRGSPAR